MASPEPRAVTKPLLNLDQAVAELQKLLGQQEALEKAVEHPTQRGEALRVVLAFVEEHRG